MFQAIGVGLQNYNRDFATRQVLLLSEVCIQRNQDIKIIFREAQKLAVFLFQTSQLPKQYDIRDPD